MTQKEQVLKYMQSHKRGISTWTAFERFGITRLSGRIYELKQDGHLIDAVTIRKKDKETGKVKTHTEYRLA